MAVSQTILSASSIAPIELPEIKVTAPPPSGNSPQFDGTLREDASLSQSQDRPRWRAHQIDVRFSEPPPIEWTPVVGSESQEVSDGRTSATVVYGRLQAASGRPSRFEWPLDRILQRTARAVS